jgi:hypothetical protein
MHSGWARLSTRSDSDEYTIVTLSFAVSSVINCQPNAVSDLAGMVGDST